MMTKITYPAIFHPEPNGGYSVDFPDLPGCVTEGDTLFEAVEMAEDALSIYLDFLKEDKEPYPKPSALDDIKTERHDFVSLVEYHEAAQRESLQDSIQNIEHGIDINRKYTDVHAVVSEVRTSLKLLAGSAVLRG